MPEAGLQNEKIYGRGEVNQLFVDRPPDEVRTLEPVLGWFLQG